jgi:hypothetical protein
VFFNDAEILRSTSQTDLYFVDVTVCYTENDNDVVLSAGEVCAAEVPTKAESLFEWHCALGHTNVKER